MMTVICDDRGSQGVDRMSHITIVNNYNRSQIDKDRIVYKNARPDFWYIAISLFSLALIASIYLFIKYRVGFERIYFIPNLSFYLIALGVISTLYILRYLILFVGIISGATIVDGIIDSYVEDQWHKEHMIDVGPMAKIRLDIKGIDKFIIVPLRAMEMVYPVGTMLKVKILGNRAYIVVKNKRKGKTDVCL